MQRASLSRPAASPTGAGKLNSHNLYAAGLLCGSRKSFFSSASTGGNFPARDSHSTVIS